MARVAILGTGLIGTSIGLRLRHNGAKDVEIVGHDRYNDFAGQAKKQGAFDRVERDPREAVRDAGLVILSAPVLANHKLMGEIASSLAPNAIVTDTGSTKAETLRQAATLLPTTVSFVGGHPMAGKELSGIGHADAALFEGHAYCVCPTVSSSPTAIKSVVGLAQTLGAAPVFIDAEEHDVYAAAISHLPLITATALFRLLRESPSWPDLGQLASTGLQDMTRLASSDPSMSNAIWKTNRESIIHWIDRFSEELTRIRGMLSDAKDEELFKLFAEVKLQHDEFVANPPRRESTAKGPEVDRQRAFLDVFVGGMLADNIRRVSKIPELMESSDGEPGDEKRRLSLGEKMEEGIRADLEKMERDREEKAKKQGDD